MEVEFEIPKELSKKETRKKKKFSKKVLPKHEEANEVKNDQPGKQDNESKDPNSNKESHTEPKSEDANSNPIDEQFDFLEVGFAFAPVEKKNGAARKDHSLALPEPKPKKAKVTGDEKADLDHKKESKAKSKQQTLSRSPHSIWIGNLNYTTTADDLKTALASCGTITRVKLPFINSRNKGFAYVDFDSPEAVSRALVLSETELGGRKLLIKDAQNFIKDGNKPPKAKPIPGEELMDPMPTLYVSNLSFTTTQDDLQEAFSKYGKVRRVRISTFEDTRRCKGYAWIDFENQRDATNALRSTQTLEIDGNLVKVEYASEEATFRGHNLPPNHPRLKAQRNLSKGDQPKNSNLSRKPPGVDIANNPNRIVFE